MRTLFNSKTFNSKISRRIFITFVTCSLLPVLIFAILSYIQITHHLEDQSLDSLRNASKSIALNIYDRLNFLEEEMEFIIYMMNNRSLVNLRGLNDRLQNRISQGFRSITLFKGSNKPQPIYNRPVIKSLQLSSDEFRHLSQGKTLIVEVALSNSKTSILMLRQVDAEKEPRCFLAGELDLKGLLTIDELADLPIDADLFILNSSQEYLYSSKPWLVKMIGTFIANSKFSTSGKLSFNADNEKYFASFTELFLRPNYQVNKWTIFLIKSKSDVFLAIDGIKRYFLLFILALFVIAIWLSIVNIRKNLDPIDSLTKVAQQFAKKDFNHKADIKSGDEFEELGRAFNVASHYLAFYYEESKKAQKILKTAQENLEKEVEARTAELAKAQKAALASNKAKSDFLANMSHELRTPLNHIIGFTELIISKNFGDLSETQEEYLNDVHESAYHLLSLVNDILDISKIEAGKTQLQTTVIDIEELLKKSLTMLKEKALKHSIKTAINIDDIPKTITADERKLKQIMYNILSNAVKFTPDGGQVSITSELYNLESEKASALDKDGGSGILVSVTDTGIGIHPENLERIFNPFEQAEDTASRKFQGTGLGLSLTKNLVEMHNGKIWAESDGIGKGSTFRFFIPV